MMRDLSLASKIPPKSSSSLRSTRSSEAKDVGFDSSSDVVPSSAVPLLGGDCNVVEDAASESESALRPADDCVGVVDINQR